MFRILLQRWRKKTHSNPISRQSGAIPYVRIEGQLVFLLVTARKRSRWVFPKGGIEPGMTPWDSAAKEAYEEAGVLGTVETSRAGSYRGTDKGLPSAVDLYPLRVETQLEQWQEKDQRVRHWAVAEEAKRLVNNREVAGIIEMLEQRSH